MLHTLLAKVGDVYFRDLLPPRMQHLAQAAPVPPPHAARASLADLPDLPQHVDEELRDAAVPENRAVEALLRCTAFEGLRPARVFCEFLQRFHMT